jgi:hypothetical protein
MAAEGHVVADHAGAFAVGGHGPCVRIGQRDLMVWRIRDRSLHHLKLPHLTPQRLQTLAQPGNVAMMACSPSEVR